MELVCSICEIVPKRVRGIKENGYYYLGSSVYILELAHLFLGLGILSGPSSQDDVSHIVNTRYRKKRIDILTVPEAMLVHNIVGNGIASEAIY